MEEQHEEITVVKFVPNYEGFKTVKDVVGFLKDMNISITLVDGDFGNTSFDPKNWKEDVIANI